MWRRLTTSRMLKTLLLPPNLGWGRRVSVNKTIFSAAWIWGQGEKSDSKRKTNNELSPIKLSTQNSLSDLLPNRGQVLIWNINCPWQTTQKYSNTDNQCWRGRSFRVYCCCELLFLCNRVYVCLRVHAADRPGKNVVFPVHQANTRRENKTHHWFRSKDTSRRMPGGRTAMFGDLEVNHSWERRRRGLWIAHHSSATGWLCLEAREQGVDGMHFEPRRRWSWRRQREGEKR